MPRRQIARRKGNRFAKGREVVNDDLSTLSDIGVSKDLSKQAKDFAKQSEEEWRETKRKWREEMATKPHGRVTVLRPDTSSDKPHVTRKTGLTEWYTPAPIVALARECMAGDRPGPCQ